jgi:ligand-binding sensor domain-containing protein
MAMVARGNDLHVLRHQTGPARLLYDDGGWRLTAGTTGFGLWRAATSLDGWLVIGGLDGSLDDGRSTLTLPSPVLQLVAREDDVVIATGESIALFTDGRVRPLMVDGADVAASALDPRASLIGTSDGAIYRLTGDVLDPVLPGGPESVTAVLRDEAHAWVGIGRAGLHRVTLDDGTEPIGLRPDHEICDNHVTSMTRHRGKLVVGTFDRGACFLDQDGWHALAELQSPMVHGVASDGQYLWVANSNGIARYDARFGFRPVGKRDPKALRWLSETAATGATEVAPGQVALTNKHGMVRIWRQKSGRVRVRFTSHDRGVPFAITAIDSAGGELFVASEKEGVKAMGLADLPVRRFQDPVFLPENWVIQTSAVSPDEVWVATCQRGVAHVAGGTSRIIDETRGLPDNMVTAVAADPHGAFIGTLWGLAWAAADSDTVRAWGVEHGVPDPRSAALFRDRTELWLGTEAGLAHFALR